ncbi:unnamed protein product [Prorocentrum cordatum]|uniref:Uncharacterized protein n=1 Tax=Prorocentrum cordatum TaxID=2364126 RepID=A0ABN9TT49_9DINO|nr:unnamed protein product [Polarella glacialis]
MFLSSWDSCVPHWGGRLGVRPRRFLAVRCFLEGARSAELPRSARLTVVRAACASALLAPLPRVATESSSSSSSSVAVPAQAETCCVRRLAAASLRFKMNIVPGGATHA